MFIGLDFSGLGNWQAWALIVPIGTAIGLAIAYLASREYIRQTIATLKETIQSQEQGLDAKDKLAVSLAEAHKATIVSLEDKLEVMTKERDAYRKDLHDTRQPMSDMALKIQEYELRPDLNKVLQQEERWHARREEFYNAMSGNQRAIIETQRDTMRIMSDIKISVDTELKQSNEVCSKVGEALHKVLESISDHDDVLIEIRDLLKEERKPAA